MFVTRASVGGAAIQVLQQSGNRLSALFVNRGTVNIYLGRDNTVLAATGFTLKPNDFAGFAGDVDEVWAIADAAAQDLEIAEVLAFLPAQLKSSTGGAVT
jgi:hypothetical protein